MSGVKKRLMKKPNATVSAVMPVRPPSRMPAAAQILICSGSEKADVSCAECDQRRKRPLKMAGCLQ
jgi:hypothetical protein